MEGECRNADGYEKNDAVLVEGIAFAEDGEMEEHYWEELARFREDEGEVVDVSETGVAEG